MIIATLKLWKPEIGSILCQTYSIQNWIQCPENIKPRRFYRKRSWRIRSIVDLIKSGLTDCYVVAHNLSAVSTLAAGRENLFINGVKPPLTNAVFLCASYCAALCRLSFMAGCFGQLNGWLASIDQYSHPTTTRRPSREKLERRITSLINGVTA